MNSKVVGGKQVFYKLNGSLNAFEVVSFILKVGGTRKFEGGGSS